MNISITHGGGREHLHTKESRDSRLIIQCDLRWPDGTRVPLSRASSNSLKSIKFRHFKINRITERTLATRARCAQGSYQGRAMRTEETWASEVSEQTELPRSLLTIGIIESTKSVPHGSLPSWKFGEKCKAVLFLFSLATNSTLSL